MTKSPAEQEIEFKTIIDNILNNLFSIIDIDFYREKLGKTLNREYMRGLDTAEIKWDMNFLPQREDTEFLTEYAHNTLKQHTDEIGNALRGEISRAILDKQGVSEIKKRVREVFKDKKFVNRMKAVLRTEMQRANNTGQMAGARQSGLELKKWLMVLQDDRTSEICQAEHTKYGTKEQAIPLDREFIVKVKVGKRMRTIRGDKPPFHPNCRTVIAFVRKDEARRG